MNSKICDCCGLNRNYDEVITINELSFQFMHKDGTGRANLRTYPKNSFDICFMCYDVKFSLRLDDVN